MLTAANRDIPAYGVFLAVCPGIDNQLIVDVYAHAVIHRRIETVHSRLKIDLTTPLCREVVRVYVMEGGAITPIKIYGAVVAFMHRVATKRRVIPEARVPLGILRLNRPCC